MMIQIQARYNESPLKGLIKIASINGLSPTKYSMTLCDDVHGVINIAKKEFPTVEKAIAHAINYNFLSHKWLIKEI